MAYPVKTWGIIKADYETGNYSVEGLAKKHEMSTHTIDARIRKEKWEKGSLKPAIEKSIQQKYIEAFAKRGVDENRLSEVLDEMLNAEKTVIIPSGQEGQSGFAEQVEDWIARDKAITQVAKLTGSYAKDDPLSINIPTPPGNLEIVIRNAFD